MILICWIFDGVILIRLVFYVLENKKTMPIFFWVMLLPANAMPDYFFERGRMNIEINEWVKTVSIVVIV